MGDETKLFRNKLKEKLPEFLFSQIESHYTAPGFPDTDYLLKNSKNITGKIELKYEKQKPERVDLEKNQYVWLRRYHRNGGRCFVAVKVGQQFIYVWEGCFALDLYEGNDIYHLPHWELNLKRSGWQLLSEILKGEL